MDMGMVIHQNVNIVNALQKKYIFKYMDVSFICVPLLPCATAALIDVNVFSRSNSNECSNDNVACLLHLQRFIQIRNPMHVQKGWSA